MNKPLDTRITICFGDDPDEIVTIAEQPRACEFQWALAAVQHMAAALASLAMTWALFGSLLLAVDAMANGATPSGGVGVSAQAS